MTCLWVGIVDGQFRVTHQRLRYQAKSWTTARRIVAKVEHHHEKTIAQLKTGLAFHSVPTQT